MDTSDRDVAAALGAARPRPPKSEPNGSPPPKNASKMSEMLPKPPKLGW